MTSCLTFLQSQSTTLTMKIALILVCFFGIVFVMGAPNKGKLWLKCSSCDSILIVLGLILEYHPTIGEMAYQIKKNYEALGKMHNQIERMDNENGDVYTGHFHDEELNSKFWLQHLLLLLYCWHWEGNHVCVSPKINCPAPHNKLQEGAL